MNIVVTQEDNAGQVLGSLGMPILILASPISVLWFIPYTAARKYKPTRVISLWNGLLNLFSGEW